jgi:hypothetical protein
MPRRVFWDEYVHGFRDEYVHGFRDEYVHGFRDSTVLPWGVPCALSAGAWFAWLPFSSSTAVLDFPEDEPPCFPP